MAGGAARGICAEGGHKCHYQARDVGEIWIPQNVPGWEEVKREARYSPLDWVGDAGRPRHSR